MLSDTNEKLPKNDNNNNEKRERRLIIINAAALTIVFAAIALFMTFGKRPNVSYEENRNLEKPPEFTWAEYRKGNVTEQFGKYYNDTVPLRSTWKLIISEFRGHLGIKYDGGVVIVGKLPVIDEPGNTSAPENSNPNIPAVVIPKPENSIPAVVIPPKPGEENSSQNSPTNSQDGEVSGRTMVMNDGRAFLLFEDTDGAAELGAGVINAAKEQLPNVAVLRQHVSVSED